MPTSESPDSADAEQADDHGARAEAIDDRVGEEPCGGHEAGEQRQPEPADERLDVEDVAHVDRRPVDAGALDEEGSNADEAERHQPQGGQRDAVRARLLRRAVGTGGGGPHARQHDGRQERDDDEGHGGMDLHRHAGLADDGGDQRGDEEAEAPEAMRAVHHAPAEQRFEPVDLDVEIDLEHAGEKADDQQTAKAVTALGIHGTSA